MSVAARSNSTMSAGATPSSRTSSAIRAATTRASARRRSGAVGNEASASGGQASTVAASVSSSSTRGAPSPAADARPGVNGTCASPCSGPSASSSTPRISGRLRKLVASSAAAPRSRSSARWARKISTSAWRKP
jgi:hypothetical protein